MGDTQAVDPLDQFSTQFTLQVKIPKYCTGRIVTIISPMHRSAFILIASLLLGIGFRWSLAFASPATQPHESPVVRADASRTLASLKLTDIAGSPVHIVSDDMKATAIVVLGTECPIANKSIAKLNYLNRSFKKGNWKAGLAGVLSDPRVGRAEAQAWAAERGVEFPVIFDATGDLALALQPTKTPEAFVIDASGSIVYRGRIDNAVTQLGKEKHDATSYDLAAAVTDVLHDRPVKVPNTPSIGCIFESWDRPRAEISPVTFARDIAPIIYSNCTICHRPGEAAPFPLLTYDDVSKRARMIAAVTESRYMPPWKPKADFGHFVHERRLTSREIDLIQQWAQAGGPMGEASDAPPPPQFASGWRLGEPDIVLKMSDSFPIPAAGRDIYRAFVLPLDLKQDAYVAGIEFRPGAATVVHHAIFYLDRNGVGKTRDAADPLPGYASFGGPGFLPTGSLGGWAPGSQPHRLPEGTGRFVAKGSDVVMQIHYHPDGVARNDQSTLAIYLQKTPVQRQVATIPLVNREIDIPAGEANYIRTARFALPIDTTIIGVTPHMHLVGREMVVTAALPDGNIVPLVHIDDWDFKWQEQYRFAKPISLPAGTVLQLSARFDNSADNPNNPNSPPRRVRRGEQTTDEMCMAFIEYVSESPADMRAMRRSFVMQRLLDGRGERDE